jgi:hypothetical protein
VWNGEGVVLRAGGDAGAGIGGVAVVGTGSLISRSVMNAADADSWWKRGGTDSQNFEHEDHFG